MSPASPGVGTKVATGVKILDYRLSKGSENAPPRKFCFPKLSLESWISIAFARTFLSIHMTRNTSLNHTTAHDEDGNQE